MCHPKVCKRLGHSQIVGLFARNNSTEPLSIRRKCSITHEIIKTWLSNTWDNESLERSLHLNIRLVRRTLKHQSCQIATMNYKALSILLVTTTGMVNGRHVRFGRSDLPATQEKTLEGGSYGSGDSVIRYEPEDIDVVTRRASDTSITPVASPLPLLIPTLHPLE